MTYCELHKSRGQKRKTTKVLLVTVVGQETGTPLNVCKICYNRLAIAEFERNKNKK